MNKRNRKYSFDINKIKAVPEEFNVAYTWVWSTVITKESIDKKLSDFASAGIKCVYILPLAKEFRPNK